MPVEKMHSINFTENNKQFCLSLFCLSLHFKGPSSYFFLNGREIYKFKAKESEIVTALFYLGSNLKDQLVDNMKNTGLNGYDYDFSVDYSAIAVDDILDIHKYLMKKNNII